MNFRIDAVLPVEAARVWEVFFAVHRIATLIPGCENVEEKLPLVEYAAVMKQKIGPFKLEVPTKIVVEARDEPRHVRIRATGRDKFTATTLDVLIDVVLEALPDGGTRLAVDSTLQVAGRLASLGYPVVKSKSEALFAEFDRRLRAELAIA